MSAATLAAADLTGKWTGHAQIDDDGEQENIPVTLDLKQSSSTISGTASSPEHGTYDIKSGKLEEDRLTFDIDSDGGPIRFALNLSGDELKGEGIQQQDDGSKMKIQMDVKREAAAAGSAAASVTGKWAGTAEWDSGSQGVSFDLKQDGSAVTGTASTDDGNMPIAHGKLEGDRFTFDADPSDGPVKVEVKVAGDQMKGTAVKMLNGSDRVDVTLTLKREQ